MELRDSNFVKDCDIRVDHLPTIFCLDVDGDGEFSEADIRGFLSWRNTLRLSSTGFLPHQWPDRCAAICARRFAEDPAISAQWLNLLSDATLRQLLENGHVLKKAEATKFWLPTASGERMAFLTKFASKYTELVDTILGWHGLRWNCGFKRLWNKTRVIILVRA
jgi:hypothetical protein